MRQGTYKYGQQSITLYMTTQLCGLTGRIIMEWSGMSDWTNPLSAAAGLMALGLSYHDVCLAKDSPWNLQAGNAE